MHVILFIWIFDDDRTQCIAPKSHSRGSIMLMVTSFVLAWKRGKRIKNHDCYMENLSFFKVVWCWQLYQPSHKRLGTWLKMEQRANPHYKLIFQTILDMNKLSTRNSNKMVLILTYPTTHCSTLKTICHQIPNFFKLMLDHLNVWI